MIKCHFSIHVETVHFKVKLEHQSGINLLSAHSFANNFLNQQKKEIIFPRKNVPDTLPTELPRPVN